MHHNLQAANSVSPRGCGSYPRSPEWRALLLLLAVLMAPVRGSAQAFNPLHSFTGGNDGASPYGSLMQASDGNLYGMTYYGGTYGSGAIFKISTSGALTPLYSFTGGSDGASPNAHLIQASDGNLYGITINGGDYYAGTVFRITTAGALTTLYSFTGGSDGENPYGSLMQAGDGNLYGMTSSGGDDSAGTVFRITTAGALTTLYSFTGGSDGENPYGSLIQAGDGNLYGLTYYGGSYNYGALFQITTAGVPTTLYSFTGGSDGATPFGELLQASDGNLYGLTYQGGANSYGTVFQITTAGTLGWTYGFTGGADGGHPDSSLIQASDGNLYGVTSVGGAHSYGTVFQITTAGAPTTLYSFTGGNDGANPDGSLMQASDGNLYGMTPKGGDDTFGAVFQVALSIPITLTFANPIVTEGSDITGTVSIPSAAPAGGTAITLSGAATGFSFKSGSTVTIPAGATSQTFKISTDPTLTSPASATITAAGNGGSARATCTAILTSMGSITLTRSSVTAGYANQGTASIGQTASGGGVQVFLSSATPGITFSPSSVWVNSGQTSSPSFTIFSNAGSFTSATTVTITGTLANGRSTSSTYTVNPVCLPTLTLSKNSCTAGDQITGTITLSIPAPTTSQNIALTGQVSGVSYQGSLNIPAGQTSGTFTITTDSSLASTVNVTVTATCNGVSSQQALTVNAETITGITASKSTILAGNSNQITVTVSQPSPKASVNVTLSSNNSGVTIQPYYGMGLGATSFTVTLTSSAAAFSSTSPVTITASLSNGSSKSTSFTVNSAQTSIAVTSVSGQIGQTVSIPATVTAGGVPLAGVSVTYQVGTGTPFVETTNSSGVATAPYTIHSNASPSQPITVSFAGHSGYLASSGTGTLTVQLPTTITVATVSGAPGQLIALSATLLGSNGQPLSGVQLSFKVGAGSPFVGTTNASGVASPHYTIPANTPGPIPVTVTFAGNYSNAGSSGTGSITVTP